MITRRYLLVTIRDLESKRVVPPKDPHQSTSLTSLVTPQGLVKAATKAHPAFKYAVVIAGIAALVAIVSKFGVSTPVLAFGVVIGLFFMFVFLIFSIAVRAKDQQLGNVVLVVVWALALLFIVVLFLLLSSSFFDMPIKLRSYLEISINIQRTMQDPQLKALTEQVQKLQEMVVVRSDPAQVQREVKLRKEEPDRFRPMALFWRNGITIRIGFLDGKKREQQHVMAVAREWTKYANLNFADAAVLESDVRVSFKTQGEWSMMGTQCLSASKNEPTTSLGGLDLNNEDQSRYEILHVFGHVLGLIHEHQTPTADLDFDWDRAYRHYAAPPNYWSKEMVDQNLRPVEEADVAYANKPFDPHSVMLYPFPGEIMISGRPVERGGSTLSQGDIALIRKIYPGR